MSSPHIHAIFEANRETGNSIDYSRAQFQEFQDQWNAYINGPLRDSLLDGSGDELLNVQAWFYNLCAQIEEYMFGTGRAVHQGTDVLETAVQTSTNAISSVYA